MYLSIYLSILNIKLVSSINCTNAKHTTLANRYRHLPFVSGLKAASAFCNSSIATAFTTLTYSWHCQQSTYLLTLLANSIANSMAVELGF